MLDNQIKKIILLFEEETNMDVFVRIEARTENYFHYSCAIYTREHNQDYWSTFIKDEGTNIIDFNSSREIIETDINLSIALNKLYELCVLYFNHNYLVYTHL